MHCTHLRVPMCSHGAAALCGMWWGVSTRVVGARRWGGVHGDGCVRTRVVRAKDKNRFGIRVDILVAPFTEKHPRCQSVRSPPWRAGKGSVKRRSDSGNDSSGLGLQ